MTPPTEPGPTRPGRTVQGPTEQGPKEQGRRTAPDTNSGTGPGTGPSTAPSTNSGTGPGKGPLPSPDQVRAWLAEVPDPEIPAISLVDLGIIRDVRHDGDSLVVTVTPTYSGCPATAVINLDIENKLRAEGVRNLRLERQLSPPWTTDWISPEGREKLRAYGIAPPVDGTAAADRTAGRVAALLGTPPTVACPRCASEDTERVSQFGSTPCKAAYRCRDCLEPFDYFKCI